MAFWKIFGLTLVIFAVLSVFWTAVVNWISVSFGIKEIYLQAVMTLLFIAELSYVVSR